MLELSDTDWQRLDGLLEEALELEPKQHADFVASVRADEPALAEHLEKLLAAALESSVLDRPLFSGPAFEPISTGTVVGAWCVDEPIGAGGMGEVYRAHRADVDFEQRVALKVMRNGLDGKDAERRFRSERQILGVLDHPNITKLVDGGVLDDHRPYLVMSYVEGVSVTTWCSDQRPSLERRLRLFVEIARAVHFAHQRLVVHRDLKPSNILVTEEGRPVLLDFGIAKLVSRDGESSMTQGGLAFTPAWAAPEQLRGQPATTATDVYALGLLLYTMLTGRRAFEHVEDRSRLPSPSADPADGLERAALRGDLDAITSCAAAVDAAERYPSAAALADDVERHLDDLPLRAPGASAMARFKKSVRRNRWPIALLSTVAIFLVGYAVTLTIQAKELREREAARQRSAERADRIADFLVTMMASANPEHGEVTVVDMVDDGTRRLEEELKDWPEVRRAVAVALADAELALGRFDASDRLLSDAIVSFEASGPVDVEGFDTFAKATLLLSRVKLRQGKVDEAESLAKRSLELAARTSQPALREADANEWIGVLAFERLRYAESRTHHRRAYEARLRVLGATHATTIRSALRVSEAYALERNEEARTEWFQKGRDAIDASEAAPRELVSSYLLLAQLAETPERHDHWRERALDVLVQIYGKHHPEVADALNDYGLAIEDRDVRRAVELLERSLEVTEAHYGEKTPRVVRALCNLGAVMREAGMLDEAERHLERALELGREVHPPKSVRLAFPLTHLSQLRHRQGRLAEAEDLGRELITLLDAHPSLHFYRGVSSFRLANVLVDRKKYSAAEAAYQRAIDELEVEKRPPLAEARAALAKLRRESP